MPKKFLLITKSDEWSEKAGLLATALLGGELCWIKGSVGQPVPEEVAWARPAYLVSFLSPWIIPSSVIGRAAAVNFHPGSAAYPGIGCYNFALYEGAKTYGAVCHRMAAKVDTGDIIEERLFDVFDHDNVATLKLRAMVTMLSMFHDFLNGVVAGHTVESTGKIWARDPFTRKQLNDLCLITPDMSAEEVRKRVRATTYPGYPGATVTLGGIVFESRCDHFLTP